MPPLTDPEPDNTTPPADPRRRGLIAGLGALIAAGMAGIAPIFSGAAVFLDPVRRGSHDPDMVFVTPLAGLPDDGVPRRFDIVADRKDAWNTHLQTPIGAVYLRRTEGARVSALNVVCPHAGCFVNIDPTSARFACPCHNSSFDYAGSINDPASPSPRAMDTLEVEIRNGDEVWVRFRNFQPGRALQIPVA